MSRRFGRNQRRRAREALAIEVAKVERASMFAQQATKQADQWHGMYLECKHDFDDLREFFAELADRVGRESVLVGGAGEFDIEDPQVRRFMAVVRTEMPCAPLDWSRPVVDSVMHEIMNRLEIDAVRDIHRQQIILRCYLGGKEAGIALSDTYLRRSTEQEITNKVAKDLARHLARAIKAAK